MTEIRFYSGRDMILSAEADIVQEGFGRPGATVAVLQFMRNSLGLNIEASDVRVTVSMGWKEGYWINAYLKDKSAIRDINLRNLLK